MAAGGGGVGERGRPRLGAPRHRAGTVGLRGSVWAGTNPGRTREGDVREARAVKQFKK